MESRASFNKSNHSSMISDSARDRLLENQFVLDEEELKIRGEIDFNEKIIKERQEELDGAESLINQTKEIAKQILVKVEEQREDLVKIEDNAQVALDNADEAEENIEKAEEH